MKNLIEYGEDVVKLYPQLAKQVALLIKPVQDAHDAYTAHGEDTGIYHAGDFNLDELNDKATCAIYDLDSKAERETYMALHVSKANAVAQRKVYR